MKKVVREHIDPRLYESIYSCLQAVNYLANTLPSSKGSERLVRVSLYGAEALHTFFDYDSPLDGSLFVKDLEAYVSTSHIQYHNQE